MSDITIYNFEGTGVRSQRTADGTVWFVAKDICDAIGISDVTSSLRSLDDDEKGPLSVRTPGGVQELQHVTEPGAYAILLRSRKPEAKRLDRWLRHEVMPSVRETGSYSRYPQPQQPLALSAAAESRAAIFEVAAFMQKMVPTIKTEMALACTLRALEAGGHLPKVVHEEMRNMLSVDWDKAPSLTPTQIGQKLGIRAEQVNKLLADRGYQRKLGKRWEPTEMGKEYAGGIPYQSEYSEHKGIQLKWAPEIVELLRQALLQTPAEPAGASVSPITLYMSKKD